MPDLHARLLAEIERREVVARQLLFEIRAHYADVICARRELAYLAALRGVVGMHTATSTLACSSCDYEELGILYPCPTIAAVAEGLGVEVE